MVVSVDRQCTIDHKTHRQVKRSGRETIKNDTKKRKTNKLMFEVNSKKGKKRIYDTSTGVKSISLPFELFQFGTDDIFLSLFSTEN